MRKVVLAILASTVLGWIADWVARYQNHSPDWAARDVGLVVTVILVLAFLNSDIGDRRA